MNGEHLISVIVPVYNVAIYLEKCIESIVGQTYQKLEIILVDDGSTDTSPEICEQWKQRDRRIVVCHKKNGGLSDARNVGMQMAKGDYLAFVDSDDSISEDTLQSMLNCAITSGSEIAVCNMIRVTEDGREKPFYSPAHEMTVLAGEQRFQTLNQPSVCNKLFRKELFEGVKFPVGRYYEDTFVYHELVYRAHSVALTGKDSYRYLQRKDSIVGRPQYTDHYFDFISAVSKRVEFLLSHHVTGYAEDACLSLYAALANAEKYIKKTPQNKDKFREARRQYEQAYQALMRPEAKIGGKQKIRLVLLKYLPKLHVKVY